MPLWVSPDGSALLSPDSGALVLGDQTWANAGCKACSTPQKVPKPGAAGQSGAEAVRLQTHLPYSYILLLGQEDPLEKEMATYSSIVAWRIPWAEELGELQSMGLQRVKCD